MNTESETKHKGAMGFVVLIALCGCAAMGFDWFMRFRWFRWDQSFLIRPTAEASGPYGPSLSHPYPASRGGDLTHLIEIPSAVKQYAEPHDAWTLISDEHGFPNVPPTDGVDYPVVVAGDSYMVCGPGLTNTFPHRLEEASGVRVYNHSFEGRGSFWGLLRFLYSDRFKDRMPKVFVWSIVERDIAGHYFAGVEAQTLYLQSLHTVTVSRARFNPHALTPSALKSSLPNTSLLAQFAARLWNQVRYHVFGRLNPYVVPSACDDHTLLYYPAIDAMRWDEKTRFMKQVIRIVNVLDDMVSERGMKFVVVLIPDKEQVYRDCIPGRFDTPDKPLRPSILSDFEAALARDGIAVVNLLPVFQAARKNGVPLYWNDDTHWRPEGIRVAAEATWESIRPYAE